MHNGSLDETVIHIGMKILVFSEASFQMHQSITAKKQAVYKQNVPAGQSIYMQHMHADPDGITLTKH